MTKKIIDPSEDVITFDELYRRLTVKAICKHPKNLAGAAEEIGVSPRTLSRWMDRFDIDLKQLNTQK